MLPLVLCSDRQTRRIPLRLSLFLLALAGLLIPALAHAASCAVTSTADTTATGTLRSCLTSQTSGEAIQFEVTGTITLTSALPEITHSMSLTGSGPAVLTISGANTYEVFAINSSSTVTISGITIAKGLGSIGGGISNIGTLTVDNCAFTGNIANSSGGAIYNGLTLTVNGVTFSGNGSNAFGGAIYNHSTNAATVANSTFAGNRSSQGGAIYGPFTVTNSTFSGNSAVANGGAFGDSGGTLTVTNSTFSGNSAGDVGGGILTGNATLTVNNSIFTGNFAPQDGGIYTAGTLSGSNNILGGDFTGECGGTGTGCFTNGTNGNQVGVTVASIGLLPLGYYGGTQQTLALLPGSVAICKGLKANAVDASSNPLTSDERGFAIDATCSSSSNVDIGAVQTNQYLVNSLIDSSDSPDNCNPIGTGSTCSLRDAIGDAASLGGDITFLSTLTSANNPGTIHLTAGSGGQGTTLGIGAETNIFGPGANQLNIDGDGDFNVGSVLTTSSEALLLYGMTITGGYTENQSGAGINNSGTLTVMASVISGNQINYTGSGAGIYSDGTLTLVDSTVSGNSLITGSTGNGGGIYSIGTLTLTESTVAGNSVPDSSSGGGGIDSNGAVTLTGSTVSGNTAIQTCHGPSFSLTCQGGSGGGILNSGTLTAGNSILAGNMAGGTANSGDCAGSNCPANGSSNIVGGNPELSGLQSNGGSVPVPTMIPLPGSPAICNGSVIYLPSGISTDERGLPITNSTYTGYTQSAPCVDAGAVQTNYALAFTGTVLPIYSVGEAMYPQISVALTESGAAATAATSPVTMSDSASVLTGATSANLSTGLATFGNLIVPDPETNDTLTASLSLNPALTTPLALTAQSTEFNVDAPAALTYPTASTLDGIDQLFTWNAGSATQYALRIGSTGAGSSNLYYGAYTTNTSVTVSNLPSNGETIYVRLFSLTSGVWLYSDYTFTAFTGSAATLTNPTSGTLGGISQLFTWSAGSGVTEYVLRIGSTGVGSTNLYNGPETTNTSVTVNNLPINGETIYVQLWSLTGGFWLSSDYTFSAFTGSAATLTNPTSGALGGISQLFSWSAGSGVTEYVLRIGTTGAGSSNLYNGPETTNTSVTVNNLPLNGETVYVRLFSLTGGFWLYNDYTFNAFAGTAATLNPLSGGSTLSGSSQLFTWTAGAGDTEYVLRIGSTGAGSSNLYNGPYTTNTSVTVTHLPVNGETVYVRLFSYTGGLWLSNDYTFTAY